MKNTLSILDLFSGMGGFSYGFASSGFDVTGIDINKTAAETYKILTGGNALVRNLYMDQVNGNYTGVIGGPPCRPWSTVNLHRRGGNHRDYNLVNVFFDTVLRIRPLFFIMENVPAIRNDPVIAESIVRMENAGYSVSSEMYRYSDFGAPVARKRFFISGMLGSENTIFDNISRKRRDYRTVRDAIWYLRNEPENSLPGHEWPHMKTIEKYKKYYITGKFGWRQLAWDSPAPSFGNIMKTYTLHPDHGIDSDDPRVISVLEALRIMGFDGYPFPHGVGRGIRYQMIVDSVSPVFSKIVGGIMHEIVSSTAGITEKQ